MKIDRRTLLTAMGLAGSSYFLPSLAGAPGSVARADAPAVPRRILFLYTEEGTMKPRWAPRAPGGGPAQEKGWDLGDLHTPLQAYKQNLTFLSGFGMDALNNVAGDFRDGHTAGSTLSLTGAKRANSSTAGGISIDQYIAKGLAAKGAVTSFESLVLGVGNPMIEGGNSMLGSGNQVPIESSAAAAFAKIMPKIMPSTGGTVDPSVAARVTRQRNILDFVRKEFAATSARASALDRARLQTHADALADLQKRLAVGATVGGQCTTPNNAVASTKYMDQLDAQLRVVQASFACDLTRVVTLYLDVPHETELFGAAGISPDSFHVDYIHQSDRGNAGIDEQVAKFHRFMSAQVARVLGTLKAITEPDGTTLLDNTIVLWCNQIAAGTDHSLDNMPFVLAGGTKSGFQTGRFLKYPNRPHNDLFSALANMMGVPTGKFGEPSIATGPVTGL